MPFGLRSNSSTDECDHQFTTHWWCEKHGRFSTGSEMAGVKHAMQCNARQWSETKCERCNLSL